VLSCLPWQGFPPLIVISPPPITVSEHVEIAKSAKEAQRRSMEAFGTDAARAEALADPEGMLGRVKTIIEHQTFQAQLTPLRSWRRKNERYRRIISEIHCRFTILLFLPDADD